MNLLSLPACSRPLLLSLAIPVLLLWLTGCASDPHAELRRLEGRWLLDPSTPGYANHPLAHGAGHYLADVRSDELWITGMVERDRIRGGRHTHMAGEKLAPYRLKLRGRRLEGYVFHPVPTEASGGVSPDLTRLHLSEETAAGLAKVEILRRAR